MTIGTEHGEQVADFINAVKRNIDPDMPFDPAGWYGLAHGYTQAVLAQHDQCPANLERDKMQNDLQQIILQHQLNVDAMITKSLSESKSN